MYALAAFISMLATWVLLQAVKAQADRRWWIAYGALVALGMYTLYMTLVIWIAHAVWLFMITKNKRQLLRQPFVLGYIVALVLFVPQLPVFIHQLIHSALPGVGSSLTLTKLVGVLTMTTLYIPEWNIDGWLSLVLLTGMILFGVACAAATRDKRHGRSVVFLAVMTLVPLMFYALTSLPPRQPMFIDRYLAHVVLFGFMLLGSVVVIGWMNTRRHVALWLGVIVIGISGIGVYRLYVAGNFNLERMQMPMTRQLSADVPCGAETTVVADDPYTYIDSVYYFENCNLRFYSKDAVTFAGGYAPLYGSHLRIASPTDVTTKRIVHLHWTGGQATFIPDTGYHVIASHTYDKQVVDIYER